MVNKKASISELKKLMIEAQKRGSKTRVCSRPRIGTRGASGPRGLWIREKMVSKIGEMASYPNRPNGELAVRINRILLKARAEQLFIENFPTEMQALNNIVIKLLKFDNVLKKNLKPKPIKLTLLEERSLKMFENK